MIRVGLNKHQIRHTRSNCIIWKGLNVVKANLERVGSECWTSGSTFHLRPFKNIVSEWQGGMLGDRICKTHNHNYYQRSATRTRKKPRNRPSSRLVWGLTEHPLFGYIRCSGFSRYNPYANFGFPERRRDLLNRKKNNCQVRINRDLSIAHRQNINRKVKAGRTQDVGVCEVCACHVSFLFHSRTPWNTRHFSDIEVRAVANRLLNGRRDSTSRTEEWKTRIRVGEIGVKEVRAITTRNHSPTPSPRTVILSLALSLPHSAHEHCSPYRLRPPAAQAIKTRIELASAYFSAAERDEAGQRIRRRRGALRQEDRTAAGEQVGLERPFRTDPLQTAQLAKRHAQTTTHSPGHQ